MTKTTILTIVIGVIFSVAVYQSATDNAKAEVYSVCNSARLEVNGQSERQCSDLQDKYGIEFHCEARNASVNNHCWTEARL